MSSMKFKAYCACGGALKGKVKSTDEKKGEQIVAVFRVIHANAGCKPCDSETARKARKQMKRKPVS